MLYTFRHKFKLNIDKKYHKLFRLLQLVLLGLIISIIAKPLIATTYIGLATNGERYIKPEQVPQQRIAIVFGAGLLPDGKPTPFLSDRVEAAVNLYHLKRVQKLLMTGDDSKVSYNEVRSMQQYAHDLGVPMKDITLDYAGFSTYDLLEANRIILCLVT